jgi:hypothetical protein
MTELIDFEWLRPAGSGGYRVTWGPKIANHRRKGFKTRAPNAPVCGIETSGKRQFVLYRPTEFPTLFQLFADAPATAEGMRDFFNKFGPLEYGDGRPKEGLAHHELTIDPVLSHHAWFRGAIAQYNAGNHSDLLTVLTWFNRGWGRLNADLRANDNGKLTFILVPASLIQFLWLQFALYAAGDVKLFRCERCGWPFIIGRGTGRRGTAMYCSNACKVRAYKLRKEAADAC